MADSGAFRAAVTAWHERQDESSRAEALRLFDDLEPWQQESILDFASVAPVEQIYYDQAAFGSIWQRWPGVDSEAWFSELQQRGLAVTDHCNSLGLTIPLAELAWSILLDPHSRHSGSRLWVQDGVVKGAQEGRSVVVVNLMWEVHVTPWRPPFAFIEAGLLYEQHLPGTPDTDYSQTTILKAGWQQLPRLSLFGQLQQLQYLNLGCYGLTGLPDNMGELVALQILELTDCRHLTALPRSVGQLEALQVLDCYRCDQLAALPESIGSLTALQRLQLTYCPQLAALPQSVCQMTQLQKLILSSYYALEALPGAVGRLANLQQLCVRQL
ncbi:hypothetical protein OEZ86_001996 [Tetradesmus obliquus]|nr:hypothetical protein OEZ86_001996 [Tetradesmus obliquus]